MTAAPGFGWISATEQAKPNVQLHADRHLMTKLSRRNFIAPLAATTVFTALGGIVLGGSSVGCGGGASSQAPDPIAGNAGLPVWAGEMQLLFDNQITPAALGMSMSGTTPSQDPALKLRAKSADVCARMRVQTVTRDTAGDVSSYTLAIQVGMPTLMPARIADRTFELVVGPGSTSFGLVQSQENSLRGRTFIGFVKRFATANGPEVYFHLTADNDEVAKVIQQVALLEELTTQ